MRGVRGLKVSGFKVSGFGFSRPGTCNLKPETIFKSETVVREAGQSFIVMLLVILPVLLLVLGITYDLGNAAAMVTIAQNAADLAAQEAGKMVDVSGFAYNQQIGLRPEAALVAQQVADDLTGGAFVVDGVYLQGAVVRVEGRVSVRTPFLHAFLGIPRITRQVSATAQAFYGIERPGQ